MRVLQVVPSIASRSGGPVRSTLATCQALVGVDSGISLTLAATHQGLDAAWRDEIERRMPGGMDLHLFPAVGYHAFMFSFPLTRWLWEHVSDYDLLVVRALLHPISSSAAGIARHHDVPYLVVPHGTLSTYTFRHRRTSLKKVYFRLVDRGTLRGAAAVRFTTKSERDQAPYWGRDTPTRVIPHPFESQKPRSGSGDANRSRVLFLSRFHSVKGLDVLMPAFRLLTEQISGAELVLAGAGTDGYEARVRDEIQELGLTDAVQLPGFVEGEDKARLLAESSVFVLPSRQESFGMAVVEAMDAGLPVVISRGVGIWQEVKEAGAGLVVDREPGAVADAITGLLRDPELGRRMGARGREMVRTRFSPERIGRQLRSLYRQVIATSDRRPGEAA